MLKKLFITAGLLISFSALTGVTAQNYTLETNGYSNPQTNINTYRQTPTKKTTGFCDAFGAGLTDGINGQMPSSSVRRNTSFLPSNVISASDISSFDPYMIDIDGTRYMLIKDNHDGVFNKDDILGYKDTISNIFSSLKPLDTNNDNRLTGEELTAGGIRLVKLSPGGKLMYEDKKSDFNNANIKFIYISGLRKAYNNNGAIGSFGNFDAVIYTPDGSSKLVTGIVTFESEFQIQKYF